MSNDVVQYTVTKLIARRNRYIWRRIERSILPLYVAWRRLASSIDAIDGTPKFIEDRIPWPPCTSTILVLEVKKLLLGPAGSL